MSLRNQSTFVTVNPSRFFYLFQQAKKGFEIQNCGLQIIVTACCCDYQPIWLTDVHLPARMFSTALATMKFLSETRPWMGFSSRFGTAALGATFLVILPTKEEKNSWVRILNSIWQGVLFHQKPVLFAWFSLFWTMRVQAIDIRGSEAYDLIDWEDWEEPYSVRTDRAVKDTHLRF